MPRLTKVLPTRRADCSFGDLVYWHLFVFGTRPDANPAAKIWKVWDLKRAAAALGLSERALRYWINDTHLPDSITGLERELFGNNRLLDDWRLELANALRATRSRNANAKSASEQAGTAAQPEASLVAMNAASEPGETEPEEAHRDGADTGEIEFYAPIHHSFEDEPKRNSRGEVINPPPEIFYASRAQQRAKRQRRAAFAAVGVTTLLGLYAWATAPPKPAGTGTVVTAEVPKADKLSEPKPTTVQPGGDNAAAKAAQENREEDARKAAEARAEAERLDRIRAENEATEKAEREQREDAARKEAERQRAEANRKRAEDADARAEGQRLARLQAVQDAADRKRRDDEGAASELNAKLKILAQAETDTCKRKLEGLPVPGFTLKCDTLIPFGKLLGAVSVSQTASSLGDCAARCRKAESPRCVAFSFDAGAHVGAASCYLTGSIPGYNVAPNWIAGTRESP